MGRSLCVFQIDSIGFYNFNVDGADYEVGGGYIVIFGGWVVRLTWNKECLGSEGGSFLFVPSLRFVHLGLYDFPSLV